MHGVGSLPLVALLATMIFHNNARHRLSTSVRCGITLLLLTTCQLAAGQPITHPLPGPSGIYVIGDTHPVSGEVAKYDLDFVSGYTLRVPWADLESWDAVNQTPIYDFSRIATTLEEVRSRGKRMTLEIFVTTVPDYILTLPGTATWTNPNPANGGEQVVAWDINALTAYQALLQHLANYTVPGTEWTVANHPALETIDAPIVGLQGLRELSGNLINHPDYERNRFITAVVEAVSYSRAAFKAKYGFIAFFAMEDNQKTPRLDDAVYEQLMQTFNQPGQPTLGFFQETLSDTGPQPTGLGATLAKASTQTYVIFQALRPWVLRNGEEIPSTIASGTPITGLAYAWQNYRSTYTELYGGDLLNSANTEALRKWNRFMLTANAMQRGLIIPTITAIDNTTVQLNWPADPLLTYQLWKSSNLIEWIPIQSTTGTVSGEATINNDPTATSMYYRVSVLQP